MSNFELWNKVENATDTLDKLHHLMGLYAESYFTCTDEEFAKSAPLYHASMETLHNLMNDLVLNASDLLQEAITGAYEMMRNEKKGAA